MFFFKQILWYYLITYYLTWFFEVIYSSYIVLAQLVTSLMMVTAFGTSDPIWSETNRISLKFHFQLFTNVTSFMNKPSMYWSHLHLLHFQRVRLPSLNEHVVISGREVVDLLRGLRILGLPLERQRALIDETNLRKKKKWFYILY